MTAITLDQLTDGTVLGDGVFDRLMAATKAHLDIVAKSNSLKGPEYAQVYLGQVQAVLSTAVQFLMNQQKVGLEAELLAKQVELADAQLLQVQAQTSLINQQIVTETQQEKVLIAQECLLQSQFGASQANVIKIGSETNLLNQKVVTEKAQTTSVGVDVDSVIGRQKSLYVAQTDGFKRDAEQKAAKLLADTWNVRRTTDEATVADTTNKLDDATIGRVIGKLLEGVGA